MRLGRRLLNSSARHRFAGGAVHEYTSSKGSRASFILEIARAPLFKMKRRFSDFGCHSRYARLVAMTICRRTTFKVRRRMDSKALELRRMHSGSPDSEQSGGLPRMRSSCPKIDQLPT